MGTIFGSSITGFSFGSMGSELNKVVVERSEECHHSWEEKVIQRLLEIITPVEIF